MSTAKMETRLLQALLADPELIAMNAVTAARAEGGITVTVAGRKPLAWAWREGLFQLTPPDAAFPGHREYETIAEAVQATRRALCDL